MYKLLIYNRPDEVSDIQFFEDLRHIPQWRRTKALSYHFLIDRVLCVKAFLLLQEGLRQMFGYVSDIEFEYIKHNKPILKCHNNKHFNLSHCKKAVMCVVADHEIGCDIEEIESDSIDNNLMRHCFNKTEIEAILADPHPGIAFTRFWTIKEAVLKLTGEGINDNLPTLLTPQLLSQLTIVTKEMPEYGYVYSIAYYN